MRDSLEKGVGVNAGREDSATLREVLDAARMSGHPSVWVDAGRIVVLTLAGMGLLCLAVILWGLS